MERMAGRWEAVGGMDRQVWSHDAQALRRDIPGIQAIEWVDRNVRVQWVEPLAGNEAAQGLDLSLDAERKAALERARDHGIAVVSRPIDLVQGGRGVLVFVPLHKAGDFDGFILGVFRADDLLPALLGRGGGQYGLELLVGGQMLFTRAGGNDVDRVRWERAEVFELFGQTWTLRATPARELLRAMRSPLPLVALLIGFLGSSLATGFAFFMARARSQSRALARAIRQFREVFESTPIGMLVVDDQGEITFSNTRAEEIFGYDSGGLRGRRVEELVPEAKRPSHIEQRREFARDGRPRLMGSHFGDLTGVRLDGSVIPLEIGLAPVVTVQGRRVIASVLDISERRKAQAQSRELTERLRLATENAHIGIYDWDVRNNVLVWDDAMYAVYGVDRERFSGAFEAWQAGLHPDDRDRASAEVQAALHRDKPFETTFRVIHPDGDVRHIQAFGLVQRDDRGRAVRMLGTNWDITAQKRAEELQRNLNSELEDRVRDRTAELDRVNEDLRRNMTALENSNRDLESFAYVASHDLQEPLRKIRAFGDLLREEIRDIDNEEAQDSLNTITSAAERMSKLIEALLIFSRASHQQSSDESVDLDMVLAEVVDDLLLPVAQADAAVEIQPLGRIAGNPVQMRQLFQNLVGNALKYSRTGVPLRISVWAEGEVDKVTGRGRRTFHVKDNGMGFDQRYADKVFLPFQRLHGRTGEQSGAGIGLAICRRIVERHHGTIDCRAEPDKGAEFIVSLPAHGEEGSVA